MARWKRKKGRSKPVKQTATYQKGMKKSMLIGGVVVGLGLAMFPMAYNEIFKRTPTIGS